MVALLQRNIYLKADSSEKNPLTCHKLGVRMYGTNWAITYYFLLPSALPVVEFRHNLWIADGLRLRNPIRYLLKLFLCLQCGNSLINREPFDFRFGFTSGDFPEARTKKLCELQPRNFTTWWALVPVSYPPEMLLLALV